MNKANVKLYVYNTYVAVLLLLIFFIIIPPTKKVKSSLRFIMRLSNELAHLRTL